MSLKEKMLDALANAPDDEAVKALITTMYNSQQIGALDINLTVRVMGNKLELLEFSKELARKPVCHLRRIVDQIGADRESRLFNITLDGVMIWTVNHAPPTRR